MEKNWILKFLVWILRALESAKISQFWRFLKIDDFQIIRKIHQFFFPKFFCFSMNFRTSFTSCRENWTVFRPKKCIFCETYIVGDEKIQKKLIFSIFFLNGQKRQWKAKMWWSFLFLFNFITQKVGKNHWKSSYFSKNWDFGSFSMRAFVKMRGYM